MTDGNPLRPLLVTAEVAELVEFAARMGGVSTSDVVAKAVLDALHKRHERPAAVTPTVDPWEPVAVVGEYNGHTVTGEFVSANERTRVTSGAFAGQTFKSPSGAATAVVGALNPDRRAAHTNGWRFWRVKATGVRLDDVYRRK